MTQAGLGFVVFFGFGVVVVAFAFGVAVDGLGVGLAGLADG